MPALPELRSAGRQKRAPEVDGEVKSQQSGHAEHDDQRYVDPAVLVRFIDTLSPDELARAELSMSLPVYTLLTIGWGGEFIAIINNAAFSVQRALKQGKPISPDQIRIIQEEVKTPLGEALQDAIQKSVDKIAAASPSGSKSYTSSSSR